MPEVCASCHEVMDVQHEVTLKYDDKAYHDDCIRMTVVMTPRHRHADGLVHGHVDGLVPHEHVFKS